MAIHYIPTEYRKPAMSTLGYWAKSMQPLMNMFMQQKMQQDTWKKQQDIIQKARAKEQDKIDFNRLREQGWQNAEEMGYGKEYMPSPTTVKQGIGLYRPQISRSDLPGGGSAIMYGNKLEKITEPKDPDVVYKNTYIDNGWIMQPVYSKKEAKIIQRIKVAKAIIKDKPREIFYTHKPSGQKIKVIEGSPQDLDFKEDVNYVRGVPTELSKDKIKKPVFDALLGKLQSLRKKRADFEAKITQMGYEYELTPSVKNARKMVDEDIRKTENLIKKQYPDLWKDYQGKKTEVERRTYQGRTLIKYNDGSIEYAN